MGMEKLLRLESHLIRAESWLLVAMVLVMLLLGSYNVLYRNVLVPWQKSLATSGPPVKVEPPKVPDKAAATPSPDKGTSDNGGFGGGFGADDGEDDDGSGGFGGGFGTDDADDEPAKKDDGDSAGGFGGGFGDDEPEEEAADGEKPAAAPDGGEKAPAEAPTDGAGGFGGGFGEDEPAEKPKPAEKPADKDDGADGFGGGFGSDDEDGDDGADGFGGGFGSDDEDGGEDDSDGFGGGFGDGAEEDPGATAAPAMRKPAKPVNAEPEGGPPPEGSFAAGMVGFIDAVKLDWIDVLLRQLVIMVGFLGAMIATRRRKHINIDAASKLLPAKVRGWITMAMNALACVVSVMLAVAGYRLVAISVEFPKEMMPFVDEWHFQLMFPLGFGLLGLHFLFRVLEDLDRNLKGLPPIASGEAAELENEKAAREAAAAQEAA